VAELKDQILRVVRDPVRKLSSRERLVAPALYAAEHGMAFEWLAKSIAAVLRYENPSDQQSANLVSMLETEGCEKVISRICGIAPGTALSAAVVQSYDQFPGFLKRLKEDRP
jgi:mannitol-1-phosphate 5-dehydrogenase